jgi:hypothetical protein
MPESEGGLEDETSYSSLVELLVQSRKRGEVKLHYSKNIFRATSSAWILEY